MVWGKAGSTTLSSAGDDVDITSLSESKSKMIISQMINSGACQNKMTFNDTGSSKYASRNEYNDDADSTQINQNFIPHWDGNDNASNPQFVVSFLCDVDGEAKIGMYFGMDRGTAGAGNTIRSRNMVYKYINTAKITRMDLNNQGAGSYNTGSNLTALGSDITPASAIPALDNVQDGSLFVDKVNARRYWFSKAPVATDDLTTDKGWVSNTSDWTYNATGDYIDFATIRRSTTAQQIYIDVQDSDYLGSGNNLSDSAWTANFKVKTGTSASGNAMIYLGFSNNLADSGTTQQSATMKMNMSSSEGSLSLSVSRGNFETSSSPVRENADIYSSGNIPYSTDFYMTMTRSGDVFTLKAYSDSARTTQVGVTATVTVTGISSLRYIKAFNDSEQTQSYTSTGARLYDMEIINGADTWTDPKFLANPYIIASETPSWGDPILRGSPNVAGQHFTTLSVNNGALLVGKTVTSVKIWLAKTGSPSGTITCALNGTTVGTQPTSAITTSHNAGGQLVTFSGTDVVIPSGSFDLTLTLSSYSGSAPSDYLYVGHNTGDVFTDGYITQSGSESGTGKDMCVELHWE